MLVARRTQDDTHFICPYCGKLFSFDDPCATKDHVVARAQWKLYKNTTRYRESLHGLVYYPNPENDPKNLIWSCFRCNRIKSDMLYIPDWKVRGRYRWWGVLDLRMHAQYFYEWADTFIEYYARQRPLYKINSWDHMYIETSIEKLYRFKAEYEQRLRDDHWYLDEV